MTVIIYSVDQEAGTEHYVWSGDLEEVIENDEGLSEEDVEALRALGDGESHCVGGGAAALHRIKCTGS